LTKAGDVELRIPKLREGSFFPALLEPRRRIDRALLAVVMEAYVHGTSTRKVDDLVKALGVDSGISKSEVSRTCAELDAEVATFRSRSLSNTSFPYVFLDASYLKARVDGRVVSPAVVIATGVTADMRPVLQLRSVRSPDAGTAVADHHDQPDAELDHAKQRVKGHIPGWPVRGQDPGELQHGCRYPQHAEQERDQD
jgi:hypothetical protein